MCASDSGLSDQKEKSMSENTFRYRIQGRVPGTYPELWEDTEHGSYDYLRAWQRMSELDPPVLGYTALRVSA